MAAPPPQGRRRARCVAVVVLGDVGRSPRMQYHAASLAGLPDTSVSLVGYAGERCVDAVERNSRVRQFLLPGSPFARLPRALFLLWAPLKALYQVAQLLWTLLFVIPAPTHVLVQNPPAIPALLAVWLACRLRGARMIIDWHNFGFSMLAHGMGPGHALVRVATAYERALAQLADGHLCVTKAMAAWLREQWGVTATVLYDRPAAVFRPSTPDEVHELLGRLGSQLPLESVAAAAAVGKAPQQGGQQGQPPKRGGGSSSSSSSGGGKAGVATPRAAPAAAASAGGRSGKVAAAAAPAAPGPATTTATTTTLLTERVQLGNGSWEVCRRPGRPALLVSSTSWTPDEDFGILLQALVLLDRAAVREPQALPDVLVVVTGKGPQRGAYEARIAALALRRVAVRTLWLEAADYPTLLGAADAGVCLHTSTSGLDLPMKVVDMFGCGLPVLAVEFKALPELVQHGVNGLTFDTPEQLAAQLQGLLRGFPGGAASPASGLGKLRRGVAAFQALRWQDNWDAHARPLFD